MGKPKTLDSFFKKKDESQSKANRPLATNIDAPVIDECPSKCPRIQLEEIDHDATSLEPNLGLTYKMKSGVLILKLVHVNPSF